MKRLLALLAALCLLTGISFAQPGPMPQPENVILMQRASFTIQYGGPTRTEGRSYNFTPVFFIYPDGKLDKSAAEELLADMDFQPTARIMWDYFKQFRRDPQTKKLIYSHE